MYTTINNVKAQIDAHETTDDALLEQFITDASRTIDRYCAGALGSDNYFVQETVTDRIMYGTVDHDRVLWVWPLKPIVSDVSHIAYQYNPSGTWISIPANYVRIDGYAVSVPGMSCPAGKLRVKMTYTGGYATIPDDIANACALLAIRFYREVKSGLTDSIGVAELGTLQYTLAIPKRVQFMLAPYRRVTP